LGHLKDLAERYQSQAIFRFVYVREAHTSVRKPDEELRRLVKELDAPWVTLRDTQAREAENAYDGWPGRVVILVDGCVAYDAGRGMNPRWDFGEIEKQLNACLAPRPATTH
jgi:hypothetical protein